MISPEQQAQIISNVRAIATVDSIVNEHDAHMLFLGVALALGMTELPPFWLINIQCGRVDRILAL